MIDLAHIIAVLSVERPVFHSEADFQLALAWKIRELDPTAAVRLEYKPFPGENARIDIWLRGESGHAIELKYLVRKLELRAGGERFELKDQGARDLSRYDVLRDLVRLERIAEASPGATGDVVVLSNDPGFWEPRATTASDAAFRIHEGRTLTGSLEWGPSAGPGTRRGRESAIRLADSYTMRWRHFSSLGAPSGHFRYLLLRVPPKSSGHRESRRPLNA